MRGADGRFFWAFPRGLAARADVFREGVAAAAFFRAGLAPRTDVFRADSVARTAFFRAGLGARAAFFRTGVAAAAAFFPAFLGFFAPALLSRRAPPARPLFAMHERYRGLLHGASGAFVHGARRAEAQNDGGGVYGRISFLSSVQPG